MKPKKLKISLELRKKFRAIQIREMAAELQKPKPVPKPRIRRVFLDDDEDFFFKEVYFGHKDW